MLRRISTRFHKSKDSEVNGVNGTNDVHDGSERKSTITNGGSTNGVSAVKPSLEKRRSSFAFKSKSRKPEKETVDHNASRSDVESSFAQFAQLLHASHRPLPTQSGDGAYLEHSEPSGLVSDIKSLGFKDAHTLMGVMKNKVTGELQDDKTYLMEKTMQASQHYVLNMQVLTW